tara:strand:- start:49 stop:423 length:375 start_codon:yes stop_codon:yes gene_type:complete
MSEESKTPVPVEEPPVDLKAERRAAAKVARAARAEKAKAESKGEVVAEVAPPAKSSAPASAPAKKVGDRSVKMSDSQKSELKTHMAAFHADGKMTVSQGKSQRMKVMSRMRKGMTLEDAVADVA